MKLDAIGVFYCKHRERYTQPHQPQEGLASQGHIKLFSGYNYETALQDLEGFDRLWLIFEFHKSNNWKPKVQPPRSDDGKKKGVFATRSPHRPNPIGMSCVRLISIEGLNIMVDHHDLLDETPIYDIKPYLPYCDAYPKVKAGWVDQLQTEEYKVHYQPEACEQLKWLEERNVMLSDLMETTLTLYPHDNPKRRIRQIKSEVDTFELAVKTWRVRFKKDDGKFFVSIKSIHSGYDKETLLGNKTSNWDDVPIHKEFLEEFYP